MSRLVSYRVLGSVEDYLADCQDLSEEQLIEFIKTQGNARKKNLLEITKYQTRDYVSCRGKLDRNLEALAGKAQALIDFEETEVKTAREIERLDGEINELTKKIAQGGGSLESQEAQVAQGKSKLDSLTSKFDEATQKKLFKYFETDSNPSLIAGIASLVALLRNNKTATNVDVELYLASFEKLMFKLRRAEVDKISLSTVQFHQA